MILSDFHFLIMSCIDLKILTYSTFQLLSKDFYLSKLFIMFSNSHSTGLTSGCIICIWIIWKDSSMIQVGGHSSRSGTFVPKFPFNSLQCQASAWEIFSKLIVVQVQNLSPIMATQSTGSAVHRWIFSSG